MILGRSALHRRGDDGFPDVVLRTYTLLCGLCLSSSRCVEPKSTQTRCSFAADITSWVATASAFQSKLATRSDFIFIGNSLATDLTV